MSRAVIKPGQSQTAARGARTLDLRDIGRQAAERVESARAEAERIVTEARAAAHAQAELIRQTAHREGYDQGLARGRETGEAAALAEARARFSQEQAGLVEALSAAIASLAARREQLYAEARRDVVVLALAIASRVFKRLPADAETASQAAEAALAEALERIGAATQAVVRAHPDDVAALERFAPQVQPGGSTAAHVRIVADAAVSPGGVVVETADSTVDATVGERLERIAEELVSDWRGRMAALGVAEGAADKPAG